METIKSDLLAAAELDAKYDVNILLWFLAGFIFTIIGILFACLYKPSPPATSLLNKSTQDISIYTHVYQAKSRHIQFALTIIGSLILVLTVFIFNYIY